MHERTRKTNWLSLIGGRAEIGRSIVRLSRLAAAAHAHAYGHAHTSANGPADSAADRLVNVAARDASHHTEVAR